LFRDDRLHLNALGYRIWSAILKSHLDARLRAWEELPALPAPVPGSP